MSDNEEDQSAPEVEKNPFSIFAKDNIMANDHIFFNNDKNNNNKNNNDVNELINEAKNLSINSKPKKIKLIPRDYQIKIYEKAKNQNSIIYVETGKGKTFISIMIMADLLGINIKNNEKKPKINKNIKIIFFVCDTALVDQQKKQIENILNIEVGTIQGKKDKKSKNDYDTFKKNGIHSIYL